MAAAQQALSAAEMQGAPGTAGQPRARLGAPDTAPARDERCQRSDRGGLAAGKPSRLQVPAVLAAALQPSRYCATQPSWKLNLREWYMIITAIFNTIVATFLSNLDNSKNLFSFQFQSSTTLVWATVWAGVSGKAQVGNKTSPCSTGISFKGTFNSTKLTCLCIHHFKMLAKNICVIWSQMNKSSPLLGTQCGSARHNCKFIC